MAWLPTRRQIIITPEPDEPEIWRTKRLLSQMLWQNFRAQARGKYRVFNAAGYRFYRSSTGPPAEGAGWFATNATLPYQPSTTFADGTWYLSASYFDGVLDSGFLPLGPHGETYLKIVLSGGALVPATPSPPLTANLIQLAGGVVRIAAVYSSLPDGANAATQWAVAYTTDGSTPATGSPTITPTMAAGPLAILSYRLPAQTNGTVVKVQVQVRRAVGAGWSYSPAAAVLTMTVATTGPTAPLGGDLWP